MYKGKVVIVEGGTDSNGRGTLLTSEECLMHPDGAQPKFYQSITKLF
jgi:agmatine/peptidylarginine deiminase